MNKNKGITLISLIITIIILLILAGITIVALNGSGLFGKTKSAKSQYSEASMKEDIQLLIMEARTQREGNLSYESLCENYLIPNNYVIEDFDSFAKITRDNSEIVLYLNKNTFDVTTEKKYEVCKVSLQTDNEMNYFENINIILKDASTGKIIQEYRIVENENEHEFLVEDGTKYIVCVTDLKNDNYEYTTPAETGMMEAIENNTREIKMLYKEKIVYLYNYGTLCDLITGGWDNEFKVANTRQYTTVKPIFNDNNITLNLTENKGIECVIGTTNKIDITNYSKVCINYQYTKNPAFSRPLCIFSDKSAFPSSYVAQITNSGWKNGVSSIDVSSLTGSYYIGSGIWNAYSAAGVETAITIYQVWLEK